MAQRDIVVIGTSSGGVEALREVMRSLPPDLPAAVFVVMHLYSRSATLLPEILGRAGSLPVLTPENGTRIEPGRVYVAPPNHHLLVEHGSIQLSRGPKENFQRPCINTTFRSAAQSYAERVVGVVLTGQLDDGSAGLWEVKRRGGTAIVQDPDDAAFPSMPQNALRDVQVDHRLPLAEIGPMLTALATTVESPTLLPQPLGCGGDTTPIELGCPDCGGLTREERYGSLITYRCRVGHTFSPKTMLAQHSVAQERALWAAVLSLEEGAELALRLSQQLEPELRERLSSEARDRRHHAQQLRTMLNERQEYELG